MNLQFGLTEDAIKKIIGVFKKHREVDEVIIYGSRAKGNFKRSSDIDITLKGENIGLQQRNEISWSLDELPLPYLFDVSVYSQIDNEDLLDHIARVGKVLYKANEVSID